VGSQRLLLRPRSESDCNRRLRTELWSEAKRGSEVGGGGGVVPRGGPGDAIQPAGQSGVRQRGADHHAVECRVDHHGMDRLICSDTLVEGDDDGESARLVVGTTDDFRQPCLRASAVPREQS